MTPSPFFNRLLRGPHLTRGRIAVALSVAVIADGLQWLLGPLGWFFFDEVVDVFAMVIQVMLLGFHPLLLPTFILEVIPVVDMAPTWTACVALVIALRKRRQNQARNFTVDSATPGDGGMRSIGGIPPSANGQRSTPPPPLPPAPH